jgi:hypothetical protein
MTEGVGGIKLRSVRFGGKRLTTDQWIAEFVEAVQIAPPDANLAHHEATAQLDALGVEA